MREGGKQKKRLVFVVGVFFFGRSLASLFHALLCPSPSRSHSSLSFSNTHRQGRAEAPQQVRDGLPRGFEVHRGVKQDGKVKSLSFARGLFSFFSMLPVVGVGVGQAEVRRRKKIESSQFSFRLSIRPRKGRAFFRSTLLSFCVLVVIAAPARPVLTQGTREQQQQLATPIT